MKRLQNNLVGIDQGDLVLFSDFEDGGEMWTGRGARERRRRIAFSEPFRTAPLVHVSLSMWDVNSETPSRIDVTTDMITREGFDIVFRTWGDTQVARVRAAWLAFGELRHADDWDLY